MGSRLYYVTADGWVINNSPRINMDNFDMTAYRNDPSNKLFIGRYRVDGNQIHIVWANNADRRDVIKFSESDANPGIDTYDSNLSMHRKEIFRKVPLVVPDRPTIHSSSFPMEHSWTTGSPIRLSTFPIPMVTAALPTLRETSAAPTPSRTRG